MSDPITISTEIHSPIHSVWTGYTSPQHIIHWNFAHPSWHCPHAENDLRVGGTYNARMEARDGSAGFNFEAVYTSIEAGRGFEYVFGDRTARIRMEEKSPGITTLTITFDPEQINPVEMQRAGWQMILDNCKQYIEQTFQG